MNRLNYKRVDKFTAVWHSLVLNKLQLLQFHPLCRVIFLRHCITLNVVNGWVSKIKGPNYFNIIIKLASLKKIYIFRFSRKKNVIPFFFPSLQFCIITNIFFEKTMNFIFVGLKKLCMHSIILCSYIYIYIYILRCSILYY